MTETMTKKKEPEAGVAAAEVLAFLKENPGFLEKHPELCDVLLPPRNRSGKGVVDFQDYMLRRLREDRDGIIREAQEIVETSRANMNNLTRINRAVLMLLEAENFEDFIHVLTMDFASLLDVDIVTLVVETDGGVIPHINIPGVHVVTQGTIDLLMKKHPIMLEPDIAGLPEVYGGGAGLVKSQALVRLAISTNVPSAMLAFGSRDAAMFSEKQGTEQLAFLGQVVERCFRAWLKIR